MGQMRRLILCAAAVVLAGAAGDARAQRPTHVAEVRLDVNGDGKPDVIRLENPAAVSVIITGQPKAGAWKPFTAARHLTGGTVSLGRGKAYPMGPVVLAVARFAEPGQPEQAEAMALLYKKGRFEELWAGPVGLRGPDRESGVQLETSEHGLLMYETRPGVERCDGATPRLYLQMLDWKQRRFRPVVGTMVDVDPAAPHLRATRARPAGATDAIPAIFRHAAASSSADAGSAGELTAPVEIDDGRMDTAWREGDGGPGRGEFLTLRSTLADAQVAALRVVPGDAANAQSFAAGNRLRRIAVVTDKQAYWVDFPVDPARDEGGAPAPYWVTFDPPLATRCVSVVIDQVYAGNGETAISELAALTDAEMSAGGLYPVLVQRVVAGGPGAEAAAQALARGGRAAADALLAAAQEKRTAAERLRLQRAMAGVRDPEVASELAAALAEPGLGSVDRESFTAALSAMGAGAVPVLRDLLAGHRGARAARVAAAAALGAIADSTAVDALMAGAGAADKQVRRAVGLALAQRPERLDALLAAANPTDDLREATLWRAIGAIADGLPDDDARVDHVATAIAARLAAAKRYEVRYRLLEAAGPLAAASTLAALAGVVGGREPGAGSVALRRVAVGALSRNRADAAIDALVAASRDPDAGVRRRAATALGERDHAPSDPALIALLAGDSWPDVRRAAAGALGPRSKRAPVAEALWTAVDRDGDRAVRLAALSALVDAAGTGGLLPQPMVDRLLTIAGDHQRDPLLRSRACTAAADSAPANAARIADVFRKAKSDALGGSTSALDVASACAGALGMMGNPASVRVLLQAAADNAFPEIQAAAVTGLGRMCPPESRELIRDLRRSPERQVSLAARAAWAHCQRAPAPPAP